MKRTKENSYFDIIRADKLKDYKILQIKEEKEYTNNGYSVYLCEVERED